jgi:small neutral amino acid transporter SnatA (MarC family)
MTGIYGMNVSQISGSDSNPNIWQFFVAVAVMNVVMVLTLAFSNWVHTIVSRGRNAGLKEVFGFAVGNISTK